MTGGKRIATAIAILFLAVVVYDSFYVIDESEQGVLTHFGRIAPPVKGPGLHFKFPRPVSKVYKVDRRIRPLTGLSQELITEDQKNVLVDGYLLWRIADPIRYVESIRTEANAVERLSDLYRSSTGIVVSNKARDAFVSLGLEHQDITVVSGEILDKVRTVAASDYGIDVIKAGIVEYTLPAENRPSVIRRMISERARIAARYRSEGEEQAIRIEAFAINEHEKIMAAAHAESTTILGRAEADAMAMLAAAYREDPAFYKFIRALDSYDSIIDRNTTLMLPADNELFKYLDGKEIPAAAPE
jgi:membrane protease subunit HflC